MSSKDNTMENKTPIQEAIEKVNERMYRTEDNRHQRSYNSGVRDAMMIIKSLLSKEKEFVGDCFDKGCTETLKEIAETFLSPSNQNQADRETDKHVFQAIGETIRKFPIPNKSQLINQLYPEK